MTYLPNLAVADEAEALSLMFHHLRLAAAFFEATPTRIDVPAGEFSASAISAWLLAMEALYPED